MLPVLSCGGYVNLLQDIVMWFSSGGTKSVLHSDNVDNINCLFSGEKELYMVDKVTFVHLWFSYKLCPIAELVLFVRHGLKFLVLGLIYIALIYCKSSVKPQGAYSFLES